MCLHIFTLPLLLLCDYIVTAFVTRFTWCNP
nr:MAG TPA: hypothetical protein [Caudoviricetes sp.]